MNPYLLLIKSSDGSTLNVTILRYTYNGLESSNYKYAGLTSYNAVRGDLEGHLALFNFDQNFGIYSQHSRVLIVLYHYQNYSSLDVSLQITLTECKPVKVVDICYLETLCN